MNPLESDRLVKRLGETTALAGVGITCPAGSATALIAAPTAAAALIASADLFLRTAHRI